jgi:protein O-mannosyl-transferase
MKRNPSILLVSLLLGVISVACYWSATTHGFIVFDDPKYVYQNEHVKAGLTWAGTVWAFTTGHASNWHPLTWISHMLDCQLFGLNSGGHHFTSLLIHALNAALLFVLLNRMTGGFWRSALVAALFAWHPLHVESVAWTAERKDVLSAFFWIVTMLAYVRYVEARQGGGLKQQEEAEPYATGADTSKAVARGTARATLFYSLALVLFALGLMAKPMLVTLPCVLLLVDFWPLQRLSFSSVRSSATPALRLLWEKVPFFGLAVGACVVTFLVQRAGGAVSSLTTVPLGLRITNALVAYARYLAKTVWPADLAVFYPLPDHWPLAAVIGSALLVVGISALAVRFHRRYPYLLVGWLWFLGTLVPTIGLVQVGSQSMADRYTYLPSIGVFVIVGWGLFDLVVSRAHLKWLVPAAAAACLVACVSGTMLQVRYWHDEETLFRHAMQVTSDNYVAYDHLAKVYETAGRNEEALSAYQEVLRLKPQYLEGRYNLGTLLMNMGNLEAAEPHLRLAVQQKPQFAQGQSNLGITLLRRNKAGEAIHHLSAAARLNPENADSHVNLGIALLAADRAQEAGGSFSTALRLAPGVPETHFLLAFALSRDHKANEAASQAEKARDMALASGQKELVAKAEDLLKVCSAR